jgi:hypothetical protein
MAGKFAARRHSPLESVRGLKCSLVDWAGGRTAGIDPKAVFNVGAMNWR